jgi:hypothetical protein
MLNNLQLTTRDQLFEEDTSLEPIDAQDIISDGSSSAELCCLRWKYAFTNFFAQGTQVSMIQTNSQGKPF